MFEGKVPAEDCEIEPVPTCVNSDIGGCKSVSAESTHPGQRTALTVVENTKQSGRRPFLSLRHQVLKKDPARRDVLKHTRKHRRVLIETKLSKPVMRFQ